MGRGWRNRDSQRGRRSGFSTTPKRRILVVCEGKQTEPGYLKGFHQKHRSNVLVVEVVSASGNPMTMVEEAIRLRDAAIQRANREGDPFLAYEATWCVFDCDQHARIPEAIQKANGNSIRLAISNPCFELWLLLHFRDNPGQQLGNRMCELLREHVPKYSKRVRYSVYAHGYEQAVKRAQKIDQDATDANEEGRNPSTTVYLLTEEIRAG
ncbi:MAG: RloB family protein [Planctomycetota bacterium]|nr:RloB family protein [Planctomycetota bacterium]